MNWKDVETEELHSITIDAYYDHYSDPSCKSQRDPTRNNGNGRARHEPRYEIDQGTKVPISATNILGFPKKFPIEKIFKGNVVLIFIEQ